MENKLHQDSVLYKKLASVRVLRALDQGQIKLIGSYCKLQNYKPHEYLIHHNCTDKNVFFLLTGKVRATLTSTRGKEIGYKDIMQGEMFGELSAIDNLPRSTSVIAIAPSVAAVINQNDFLKLLKNNTEISQVVLQHLTRMVRDLCEKVFEFGTLNIRERFYLELLRIAQPFLSNSLRVEISPVPTHDQISNMIGANREAVTREINLLKNTGLIQYQRSHPLVITNIKALEKLAKNINKLGLL